MSSSNLVIDEGNLSVSGDVRQCSTSGYIILHGLFCLHAKDQYTRLGHTIVMKIWNAEAQQRQRYLNWDELYHIMSVLKRSSYLLVMLSSQDMFTIIFTVKFEINNIAFTIKSSFEDQSNWNMNWITLLCYAMHICLFYRLWFRWHCYLLQGHVAYNQAKFQHPTTFGRSHFEFDAYHETLPVASDLKLFWAVYIPGTPGLCFHYRCAVYGVCKSSGTLWTSFICKWHPFITIM